MFTCSKKEQLEKEATFQNRIMYSLPVRLGTWNEELAQRDERDRINKYKQEHCQLFIQKTRRRMSNVLTPTTLCLDPSYVLYGQNYQIKTSDFVDSINQDNQSLDPKYRALVNMKKGLYLSCIIPESEVDSVQHFTHRCPVIASRVREQFVRNTFRIVGCKGQGGGEKVACGDDVMIEICECGDPVPLYLHCENPTTDTVGEHLTLHLSQSPDIYSRFKILHWNPNKRYETMGAPFEPNSRIVIQHTASGRNLAVEPTKWILTMFGPECTVSCNTYRDTHKMETAENFWMLMSQPASNTNLFVRAAKGDNSIPHELFD